MLKSLREIFVWEGNLWMLHEYFWILNKEIVTKIGNDIFGWIYMLKWFLFGLNYQQPLIKKKKIPQITQKVAKIHRTKQF